MQQFSARRLSGPHRVCLFLAAGCLLLTGCRKEEIRTFSVPKDTNAVSVATTRATGPAQIRWSTPSGWVEQPAGGIRAGSFAVAKGDQSADVSIIPLGGISGSELDNVNRWRNQVGLGPIKEADLKSAAEEVVIGSTPARLYDLGGPDADGKQGMRILAAILPGEGVKWFFKMTGPDPLVTEEKPAFKELLKSVRFEAGPPDQPAAADGPMPPLPEGHPPLSAVPPQAGAPQPGGMIAEHGGGGAAEKPAWNVPTGWQEQPASSMRAGSFLVTGENGAAADVSVIKLGTDSGGLLGNVNRWRTQVGLEPVDEAGLAKLITSQKVNGAEVTFVELAGRSVESGDPARLLAAIAPRPGGTWYYKMLGNDQLVAQQKDAFVKFVESARYPNAL